MKNKYVFVLVLLVIILAAGAVFTTLFVRHRGSDRGEEEFTVAVSFYPMYVAAENVIGDCDGVQLESLTEQQAGHLHDYQLTTENMKLLSTADVFVINGGGIETFLSEVAQQYPALTVVDASEGISLVGDNAHVWMSITNYMEEVQNICDGLTAADADASHGEIYRQNTEEYLNELEELAGEAADLADELAGQPVVIFGEVYEYLADELSLSTVGLLDLDDERQVSAGEVAEILSVIENEHVPVIFAEELYAKDMAERVEQETDVQVLYLDSLTSGDYAADSYLSGMRQNLQMIQNAYE